MLKQKRKIASHFLMDPKNNRMSRYSFDGGGDILSPLLPFFRLTSSLKGFWQPVMGSLFHVFFATSVSVIITELNWKVLGEWEKDLKEAKNERETQSNWFVMVVVYRSFFQISWENPIREICSTNFYFFSIVFFSTQVINHFSYNSNLPFFYYYFFSGRVPK